MKIIMRNVLSLNADELIIRGVCSERLIYSYRLDWIYFNMYRIGDTNSNYIEGCSYAFYLTIQNISTHINELHLLPFRVDWENEIFPVMYNNISSNEELSKNIDLPIKLKKNMFHSKIGFGDMVITKISYTDINDIVVILANMKRRPKICRIYSHFYENNAITVQCVNEKNRNGNYLARITIRDCFKNVDKINSFKPFLDWENNILPIIFALKISKDLEQEVNIKIWEDL